jgi:hypothetical protein
LYNLPFRYTLLSSLALTFYSVCLGVGNMRGKEMEIRFKALASDEPIEEYIEVVYMILYSRELPAEESLSRTPQKPSFFLL